MPGIRALLSNHDLDFLNRVARFWKVEISQHDVSSASQDLQRQMISDQNLDAVLIRFPEPMQNAWQDLLTHNGQIPWTIFNRTYGEIRDLGPARRERENPDQNPVSITESLWYTGLIGKGFLKVDNDLVEMIFIPDEILKLVSPPEHKNEFPTVRPSINQKPRFTELADSAILDHLTDVLAAMRMSRQLPTQIFSSWGIPSSFLAGILTSNGMISSQGQPIPETLRTFFKQDRATLMISLFKAWVKTTEINELRLLPGLLFEGSWTNDPQPARQTLLSVVSALQPKTWWSISSIISLIKEQNPDFLRTAGDYDSWFIREEGNENFLRGFAHWDEVEGRLLESLLTGPFHWWGLVNLGREEADRKYTSFQLTSVAKSMIEGSITTDKKEIIEDTQIEFKGPSTLIIPVKASRELRYQVGRFCELIKTTRTDSWYSLTPFSLESASRQGLHIHQLVQLLEKYQEKPLSLAFKKLASRWQENGLEAGITTGLLLRFTTEEACQLFLRDPRSAKLIEEQLTPRVIMIHKSSIDGARNLLAELGILAQTQAEL